MVILDNAKNIRSFGRINGRGVLKSYGEYIEKELPKHCFPVQENLNFSDIFNNKNENYLEIGCGYGESIAERAKQNRTVNFIACETYVRGVISLINLIKDYKLDNLKIFNGDARILLENLEDNQIDRLFLLFPDPWPKKRQHKRRIVNEEFLSLIVKKMKNKSIFFFASDIDSYIDWAIEKIEQNGLFRKKFDCIEDCENEPWWWVRTKYQEKAIKEGRASKFCEFVLLKELYYTDTNLIK